jgi:hypothetical protein
MNAWMVQVPLPTWNPWGKHKMGLLMECILNRPVNGVCNLNRGGGLSALVVQCGGNWQLGHALLVLLGTNTALTRCKLLCAKDNSRIAASIFPVHGWDRGSA